MDLLSDVVPLIFYERLRRRILSKVGDRFAYGMGLLDVAWREKDRHDGPFGPVPEQWWVVALLGLLAF